MEDKHNPKHFETISIHASKVKDYNFSSVIPPIVTSVTFEVDCDELVTSSSLPKYVYTRLGNPTTQTLEQSLAALEGAKYAVCSSSGTSSLTSLLAILKPGSHIICSDTIYGGTLGFLSTISKTFSFTTSYVHVYNLEKLKNSIQPNTALIWVETLSNPLMKVADIKSISKIAHEHDVVLAVDNTLLTPYFHRPLEFGADIVCHSVTKYINGHCDVTMGVLLVNKKELYDKIWFAQTNMGATSSPVDCSQVLRSLKTLSLRMEKHKENAFKVAQYLSTHKKILRVIHPSLPNFTQQELFNSQASGHSGLVSFYVNGNLKQTTRLINNLKLIICTSSFGSAYTIVELPLFLSQLDVPLDKKHPDVTDNLIRMSVGLENAEDIINDLQQALESL